jgi:hypothetical protein
MRVHIVKHMVMDRSGGVNVLQKLRTGTVKVGNKFLDNWVRGSESALVVSWWDIIMLCVYTYAHFYVPWASC